MHAHCILTFPPNTHLFLVHVIIFFNDIICFLFHHLLLLAINLSLFRLFNSQHPPLRKTLRKFAQKAPLRKFSYSSTRSVRSFFINIIPGTKAPGILCVTKSNASVQLASDINDLLWRV